MPLESMRLTMSRAFLGRQATRPLRRILRLAGGERGRASMRAAAWDDETGALTSTSGPGEDVLRRVLSEIPEGSSGARVGAASAAVAQFSCAEGWSMVSLLIDGELV